MKPLWQHQVEAIRRAETERDLGLFFEQGTGKTRTMIEILRRKYAVKEHIRKTLIICPVIVCRNWKAEFKQYSNINQKDIVILEGTGVQREASMRKVLEDPNKIVITNFETLQMKKVVALMHQWTPEILVIDESQRVKTPESIRAKACVVFADKTAHNYILSGTPILDGQGMDIFMQFRILDRGESFGKSFYAFRAAFFYDKNSGMNKINYFPNWTPHPNTYDTVERRVKKKSIRVLKKDCLDLPELVRTTIEVDMSPSQRKAYKEMYNDCITFLEEANKLNPPAVAAQLALVKALRLMQIASGFVRDDDGNIHRFPCPKLDVLKELLTQLCIEGGHKVIVWASFKENYKMIEEVCTALGIEYRTLTGDTSPSERHINMNDFRTEPNVKVMIANQSAGGTGINLVEAKYAIYYSKNFKLEDDLQSEARNYRGGSEIHDKVTRIDLITTNTIDVQATQALHNKQQVSISILGDR